MILYLSMFNEHSKVEVNLKLSTNNTFIYKTTLVSLFPTLLQYVSIKRYPAHKTKST